MLEKTCLSILMGTLFLTLATVGVASDFKCTPTPPDAKGPFYKPDAPMRSTVGTGYVLTGRVRSAKDCSPVAGARIEFWMAGQNGRYDDAYRGTIITDQLGLYRIESDFPADYAFRPPHIHFQVTADRFEALVTQHYLQTGSQKGVFELVLIPD